MTPLDFFATAPRGIEPLLADELRALGLDAVRETRGGVAFSGALAQAYRACLWSRVASRILMPLARFPAPTPEALYAGARTIPWGNHIAPTGTLSVDAAVAHSAITHSHYAALKVKDAIADLLREDTGERPSVDTARPDIRVNLYLLRDEATISLDLSGESLHRRGWRFESVEAPLKENLAAAILLRAGWPDVARTGGAFTDPMCGSGTLVIEAAMIAGDIAPGIRRPYFGFSRWLGHDAGAFGALKTEAAERATAGRTTLAGIRIDGFDRDPAAIHAARGNAKRAGLEGIVHFDVRDIAHCIPADRPSGLVAVNPPYGERIGESATMPALYSALGQALRRCFPGWRAAMLTSDLALGRLTGLRAHKVHTLWNGAIECRLLHFDLGGMRPPATPVDAAAPVDAFVNRLRKDYRHFGKFAKRAGINAWRVYDADLNEYNLAIDVYESAQRHVHVQEYEAPATIDPARAERRLADALAVIPEVLEVAPERMYYKRRRRQKAGGQYERLDEAREYHEVREGPCRLLVNFTDYLDTGLFLDHRDTRALIGRLAQGKHFLNLFGYTGAATVHAALGGALSTTTVDMSHTYLAWAEANLQRNGIQARDHHLVQDDVLQWLRQPHRQRYGLIFLDPPSFSRSKRMDGTLDVQRDQVGLIRSCVDLLEPDGLLIFSTNLRGFKLDAEALSDLDIEDISRSTIPKDFERNPKIHQCFRIRARV